MPYLHTKGLTHNAITKHKMYRSLLLLSMYYDTFGQLMDKGKQIFFKKLWEKVYERKQSLTTEDRQKLHMLLLQLSHENSQNKKIQNKFRHIEKAIYNYVD